MSQAGDTEKGKDAGQESWLKKLGPGLITGAADDDPSGIATYSQAGAQFGFRMLWTVLLTYPLMVGIQMISAEIGRVRWTWLGHKYSPTLSFWTAVCDRRTSVNCQHDQYRC